MSSVLRSSLPLGRIAIRASSSVGEVGSGVGKSGGSGGSIRDAGGAFGKLEAARESEYFYNLTKEQLKSLKAKLRQEMQLHTDQVLIRQQQQHKRIVMYVDDPDLLMMILDKYKKRIAELDRAKGAHA